jgi:hypothetical protein
LLLHFISLKFYLTIWTRWLIWIWHLLSHSDLRKRCCSLILLNVEFSSGRKRRKIICFVWTSVAGVVHFFSLTLLPFPFWFFDRFFRIW